MQPFRQLPIAVMALSSLFFSFSIFGNDQVNSFRQCLQRERDVIYNNTKMCSAGNSVDLTGGTEAEGIAPQVSCPAKDYALSKVAEKCRKESFIADATESTTSITDKPSVPGTPRTSEFIDGGTSLKTPPPYKVSSTTSQALAKKSQTSSVPSAKRSDSDQGDSASRQPETTNSPLSRRQVPARWTSTSVNEDDALSGNDSASSSKPRTDSSKNQSQYSPPQSKVPESNPSAVRRNIDIDTDLATCRQAQSKAQQCCGSPTACLTSQDRANYIQLMSGGSEDEGLSDACDRLNRATALSGDLNGKVAALCMNNQYACQNTCAGLVTKYQDLLDQCGDDCDNYSTYQDTIASLQSQQTSCASLTGRADSLSIQTLSSGQDQGLAAACQQKTGSSSLGGASMPSYGDRGSGGSSDYSLNAQTPGAQVSARAQSAFASGEAAAAQLSSGTAAPLAQLSAAGGDSGSGGTYYGQAVPGQPAASVRPIPNGGGAFGAGGATSPNNASVRANLRAPGDSIISTDIDQGFRSGGYSQTPGSDGAPPPQPTRSLASVMGSATIPSGYEGMDLKDFLPGGKYYRGDAMNPAAPRSEINPKEVDIFQRISNKMQEKCKLGVLWRCRDE